MWAQLRPSSVWSTSRRRAHGVVSIRQVKGVAIVYLEETNLIKLFPVTTGGCEGLAVIEALASIAKMAGLDGVVACYSMT